MSAFLPANAIRALAGALVVAALGLPWLARYVGALDAADKSSVEQVTQTVQLRPELVRLPGGRFLMGSPAGEQGRDDDETLHEAEVAPFEICRTEVTVAQWFTVMNNKPSDCNHGCDDDNPVQNVSWEDSLRYLNTLTAMENDYFPEQSPMTMCYEKSNDRWTWISGCTGFRLPTETEWEYAARADTRTAYSFGADASKLDNYAWYSKNSDGRVHEVASKTANTWGLYDMHGNVWEWIWDWHGEYPSKTPSGYRGSQDDRSRVLRGGSFYFWPENLRSAFRDDLPPTKPCVDVGLRCARSLSAEPLEPSAH
ncbi:MAG: formylglycine-generating enzyme family protein [Myxococcota bacterium]